MLEKEIISSNKASSVNKRGHAQQGNIRFLEKAIHEHWALGQNIVLCWTPSKVGIDILVVPHYYLGNFSASLDDNGGFGTAVKSGGLGVVNESIDENGGFIRDLIATKRLMTRATFDEAMHKLALRKTSIRTPIPLSEDKHLLQCIEELVTRHSVSFVPKRAVLLFDIVDFSLYTPFEQTSQLMSLSYSLNSAYNKMRQQNIDIDFSRTTTGDGFYVWGRSIEPSSTMHLFQFMLLVLADNALAQRKARRNSAPTIRTGFHVGSHYEFYQAEALNPTMNSYIVGDVTIELARMLDMAAPGQIFVGDFTTEIPTSNREGAYLIEVNTQKFMDRTVKNHLDLYGVVFSGEEVVSIHSYLTGETGISAGQILRRFKITDKHGRSRYAFNLRCNIHIKNGKPIILGLQDYYLPKGSRSQRNSLAAGRSITTLYPRARQAPDIIEDRD